MKKIILLALTAALLLVFSGTALADNAVSGMANTCGGRAVANCAQMMNNGVSTCAMMPSCPMMNP